MAHLGVAVVVEMRLDGLDGAWTDISSDVLADLSCTYGISGGGAATFWIAAGDERVKATVPVSGLSDLISQVPHRVVNGHCDCMFLYNTYQWAWARVAGTFQAAWSSG